MTVIDDDDLLLVDSSLASDTFNKIARARITPLASNARIAGAVQYFRTARRPFAWWVGPCSRPLDLETRLLDYGLCTAESELGMALDLRNLRSPAYQVANLVVERVSTPEQVSDFSRVVSENWKPPDPVVELFYNKAASVLLAQDCPMKLFVGYLHSEPVSVSELFIGAKVAGIYSVATRKPFRKRGIGSVLTWVAADEARRTGIPVALLQSSEDGKGIYSRLGFKPCCHFAEYTLSG